MKITELIEKLEAIRDKDPEATVDVVGYSTIVVTGKNIEVPIAL